jgi:hypothetical protein
VFGRPAFQYDPPEMARTSAGISDALPHRLEAIAAQVRRERASSARALGLGKLTRGEQVELLSALGRAGLEHTGKAIRVPLAEQVRDCLAQAGGQGLLQAHLAREVKGARSAAELRHTLQALLEQGAIVKLVDEGGMRLTTSAARALTGAELDQLAALAKRLGVLARATRARDNGPRPTLARRVLEAPRALLNQLAGVREPAPAPESCSRAEPRASTLAPRAPASEPSTEVVAGDALQQQLLAAFLVAPAPAGLIRVPDVIRALEPFHPRAALLAAASALARRGEIELRPEASIGRLAREQRMRCPRALDGTPLSNARLLSPAGAQP